MDSLPNLKPFDLQIFLPILDHIGKARLLSRFDVEIQARVQDIKERVPHVTTDRYEVIIHEKQSAPEVNRVLLLRLMTDEIEKWQKGLDKRFPKPLPG